MKKTLLGTITALAILLTVAISHAEWLDLKDCGCPDGVGINHTSYYQWESVSNQGHILREITKCYCKRCGDYLGDTNVIWTDIEPHEYDGYECTICGYWRLGEPSMYGNSSYSSLRNASVGSIVTFGNYEQDGVYGNGAEPIEWIVLERRGSQVLLLSRYGLDAQPYHHTSTAVNWSGSSVRAWLQNEFYREAFSAEERKMIRTTHNSTPVNSNNAGSPGPDTYDTVFFLSSSEATRYLSTPESRMVKATSYALMRGAETNYSQNSYWWLRSYADGSRRKVLMINSQGNVYASGMNDYGAVVRPAVWLAVD